MTAAGAWARLGSTTAAAVALVLWLSPPEPPLRLGLVSAALAGLAAGGTLAAVTGSRAARRVSLAQLALLAVAAANEEVIWRRILLGELLRGGATAALAGSTVAFALAHRARPGLHLVTGATFGGLYLATGGLAAAIGGHWAYNATLAVLGSRRPEGLPP